MIATVKKTAGKVTGKVNERLEKINDNNPVFKVPRRIWLAGLGALSESKDGFESVFERLVEKGEATEKDATGLVSEWLNRSKIDVDQVEDKIESILDERIETVLNSMNIPSKKDIESLGRKISTLSRKVNDLDKKLSDATRKAA